MSFENEHSKNNYKVEDSEKLDFSIMKYFWLANPLTGDKQKSIPRFLRRLKVFKNFTDLEIRILIKFLHLRQFDPSEVIFNPGDLGIGYYIIFTGLVEINDDVVDDKTQKMILERGDSFGELSLLRTRDVRNAQAISLEKSTLLGIYKPDLEELVSQYPVVATKLLQALSEIVSERFLSLNIELNRLRQKLHKMNEDSVE